MYFDRVVNQVEASVGAILLMLKEEVMPITKQLNFYVINNEAEYETCALGTPF